jgi:N-sulphoglucosamine sulphohydrolase, C-terminal
VFTSDNGPEAIWPWQGSSGPWRGYYFTHMEGSLRVPFIIRWPGRIAAGRVSNELVHEADTFTTLATIAGASVPQDRPIDGVDQTDFLLGKSDKSNREGFPVFVADRLEAVKWGAPGNSCSTTSNAIGGPRPLSSGNRRHSIASLIRKRNTRGPESATPGPLVRP